MLAFSSQRENVTSPLRGHGKDDVYLAYTGQHYMLLSRGTDASSTNYDDSSDKGKHFHFVTTRYDYFRNTRELDHSCIQGLSSTTLVFVCLGASQ